MGRARLLAPLVVAGLLAVAPSAGAAMTCSEPTGQAKLVVTSDDVGPASKPIIGRDAAGKITVDAFDPNASIPTCAPNVLTSTVNNIASIEVTGPAGLPAGVDLPIVSQFNGLLAPGSVDTPPDDEIKITVTGWRGVSVSASDTVAILQAGTKGIDMDGDGDVDLSFAPGTDPDELDLVGSASPDILSAAGGRQTGGPVTYPVGLFGFDGNDFLFGGEGDDLLIGRRGDDVTDGRGGTDRADYSDFSGVRVDLAQKGRQDTGEAGMDALLNIEDLRGGAGNDQLFGDDGPNDIIGDAGADVIDPRGGADRVEGDAGADAIRVRDGGRDTVDCGDGADSVVTDLPGTDGLTACESTDAAPSASVAGGPGLTNDRTPAFALSVGEAGAALQCRFDAEPGFTPCGLSFSAPVALADGGHTLVVRGVDAQGPSLQPTSHRFTVDATAPRISGLHATTLGRRSARLSFALSEGGAVALRAERLERGRKVRGRCRAATPRRRGRPVCTRVLAAGHLAPVPKVAGDATRGFRGRTIRKGELRRLPAGRYRLTLRATDAAGNVSAAARVTVRLRSTS